MEDILTVREHHLELKADPHNMKVIAVALGDYVKKHGLEDGTTLNDFIFNMETAYQRYHDLEPDDWGFVREEE